MIESAGYMVQDKNGAAIFGIGSTPDEAWKAVVDEVRNFFDSRGDVIPAELARETQFKTYPASAALLNHVRSEGGAIDWDILHGIVCTVDEYEAFIAENDV